MASPPVLPDAILGPADGPKPPTSGGDSLPGQRQVIPGGQVEPGTLVPPSAGGVSDSPALTKKSRDTALIAQRDARIRKKATDIVLSALRAPETAELPEGALESPPHGWTKRQLRIALDATNSMKAAPAYLGMAQRILESYRKAESDENKPAPVLNATQVVVHQEFHYPTIKVER